MSGYNFVGGTVIGQNPEIAAQQKVVTFNICANGSIATQAFFIADIPYVVTGIKYVHKTKCTGTAVANITKDTGVQAPGAGSSTQTGTFDPTGDNNVVQTATLTATNTTLNLAAGDRLSFKVTGTTTSWAGVAVSVYMLPYGTTNTAVYYAGVNADVTTQTFFIAQRDLTVTGVKACWSTAFAGAVTLNVMKDTGTTAAGGGTSILTAAMAADGTANTVLSPALAATAATLSLSPGDRLSVKFSAVTTGINPCVVVSFAPKPLDQFPTWQLSLTGQQQVAQCFFIADRDYEFMDAACVYDIQASGAAKIGITIDKGTTAPGAGTVVQTDNTSAGFDLNTTVRVVQYATITNRSRRMLTAGDRLGFVIAGGAQAVAQVCISTVLIPK